MIQLLYQWTCEANYLVSSIKWSFISAWHWPVSLTVFQQSTTHMIIQ